ncbi:MAG: hypothetical protein AAF958_04280 [Planctomycetota bacterium]
MIPHSRPLPVSWTGRSIRFAAVLLVLIACLAAPANLHGAKYTPESPEVQAMVSQLIGVLEANVGAKTMFSLNDPYSGGYGELALAGYAHYKTRYDDQHPVVQRGVEASKTFLRRLGEPDDGLHRSKTVYQAAICALLLAEVGAEEYRSELKQYNSLFKRIQFGNGAYSYPEEPTGDVSQTQYAMLALWKLDRLGIRIDDKGIARTGSWLMSVQDVGGGWPYQGVIAPAGQKIRQAGVTPSMAVAGGSALLIAGDILRSWGATFGDEDDPNVPGFPKAIRVYLGDSSGRPKVRATLPSERMKAAIAECDGWLAANSPDPGKLKSKYPMYQLYTLERYRSFREVALEKPDPKSPDWYNGGVEYIKKAIKEDHITGSSENSVSTGASFAILFLIRSTKKSILAMSGGTMSGGRELPDDTSDIKIEGGSVKAKTAMTSVNDLLGMLEKDGADGLAGKSIPDNLKLATDPKERKAQLDRLVRLARGSDSYQARRVAWRLIGQSDSLDMVPHLIYGLGEKDTASRVYARDGLRFISRKFDGFDMPNKPTPTELLTAEDDWKEWYLTMNPSYVFLD